MKRILPRLVVGACCASAVLGLYATGTIDALERKLYDWRVAHLPPLGPLPQAVLFAHISQEGIETVYKQTEEIGWPWPRSWYRDALVAASRADVVLFDMLFEFPSAFSDDDSQFAQGLSRHGKSILSCVYGEGADDAPAPFMIKVEGETLRLPRVGHITMPHATLAKNAAGFGFVRSFPDLDGVFRRYPLMYQKGDRIMPSLGLAALMKREGVNGIRISPDFVVHVGRLEIPVDREGKALIRFYGPRLTLPHERLEGLANIGYSKKVREDLAGKLIVVGTTAPGLMDHVPAPTDEFFYGGEIHATMLANALRGDFIRPPSGSETAGFVLGAGLLAGLLFVGTRLRLSVPASAVIVVLLAVAAVIEFRSRRWLEVSYPLVATALTFAVAQGYNYGVEGRRRREILSTFKRYVSPQVVEKLLENPKLLDLGGSRTRITAMFLDFEGFTKLSEKTDAHEVMDLLNFYHDRGTKEVFGTDGTLDKYVGDAIVAFWGAPLVQPDHAARACRAAVAIQAVMKELSKDGRSLRARIGLNTGEAIVGNVGSTVLQNFSMIGDEVNLASRLEGANKAFGTRILISESTYLDARDVAVVREVGLIRVVGRQKPVRAFELVGIKGRCDETGTEAFAQGWEKVRAKDFEGADAIFSRFDDKLSQLLAAHCRRKPEDFVIDIETK